MSQTLRVLIVDDRPATRAGLNALLTAQTDLAGMAIQVIAEACNGREAVQQVEALHPEIVLMDAHMPDVDGLQATRMIKARWPDIRVLILTLYPAHRAEALAAGADGFLLKGCPADELLQALARLAAPLDLHPSA
jgi:DNA-binding NarL/FixJ family response regulator